MDSTSARFFDTFGFLILRGALRDEIDWIVDEHAAVFTDRGVEHSGQQRTLIVPFIDQRQRLAALLDHHVVTGVLDTVLGEAWNYVGSDGNYYSGDTGWHSDGFHTVGRFAKVAIYLDPVSSDSGALRVIPGSHRDPQIPSRQAPSSQELWGIAGDDVPALSLDSEPGDVVVFNHNLMHSAWGGSRSRRMFTMNCSTHARTEEEVADLRKYIGSLAAFSMDRVHGDVMRETASPSRMVHLRQVMENEDELVAAVAASRAAAAAVS